MKVEFVDGEYDISALGNTVYLNESSWLKAGGFYDSDINKIVVVKQKYQFYTIIIILHELLHYLNAEFFNGNYRINNLIDESFEVIIAPLLVKAIIWMDKKYEQDKSQTPLQR